MYACSWGGFADVKLTINEPALDVCMLRVVLCVNTFAPKPTEHTHGCFTFQLVQSLNDLPTQNDLQ